MEVLVSQTPCTPWNSYKIELRIPYEASLKNHRDAKEQWLHPGLLASIYLENRPSYLSRRLDHFHH